MCVCLYVYPFMRLYFSACLCTKDAGISIIYSVPGCVCLCMPPLFHPLFSLYARLCGLLPHTVFAAFSACMCVCDELAGNWLLNGATAAMWDKIETRETERPIHLLSANQPRKTTGPFIKPQSPPAERQHTHTLAHRRRHSQFHPRVSLTTCHFWQTIRVKICTIAKLKMFTQTSRAE